MDDGNMILSNNHVHVQGQDVGEDDKVRIVSDFILHSPPGEFNEVFNDVRVLLNNDQLLKEGASNAFAQYNKDQLTPVRITLNNTNNTNNNTTHAIITDHNELQGNRFIEPRNRLSFRYDHLRKEASDIEPHEPPAASEPWRSALDAELLTYCHDHYPHGVCAVFPRNHSDSSSASVSLVACIEDHQFEPKNFWNGRWRSVWSANISPAGIELRGVLKVQVHYYEDGNVQLVSSKEVKVNLPSSANEAAGAKEIVKQVMEAESAYQAAISENYKTMSDTTFKALRRQLPVTRTKIDWTRIVSYSIGKELKSQ